MYAIVDIETTGGHASANGITDIAILIHDGICITKRFQSLVNPGVSIPYFIQSLTGINDEMVKDAPSFNEIAGEVFRLLSSAVFVAHNVNFDYSFIKHHLAASGYELNCKKLCTIRLGRRIFPGLPSYSLGKLCTSLKIPNLNRHRAAGDAEATAVLFSLLLKNDLNGHIDQFINKKTSEQQLPPHLQKSDIDRLPKHPGVYYFHDQRGKVIYVGKAINIKKRVCSHFSGNNAGKQRQEFLKNVCSISHRVCGTELMAFILEAVEIKRLWPANNRSMKRFEAAYGLYTYEDQKGLIRLVIDKKRKNSTPLHSFNTISEGYSLLHTLIEKFELCPRLCFVQKTGQVCEVHSSDSVCHGACCGKEDAGVYNIRVNDAVSDLKTILPSFLLIGNGRTDEEKSIIMMEKGNLHGMGYVSNKMDSSSFATIKPYLELYPSNDYIRNIIMKHASKYPERVSAGF
ncbi:DNA polymerase III epsilon subunit [Arcticibacter svalbardensis MN12-7]|uniref:DNA polymerase III epsilon subunit n=1 Tax=Arcticibacter svalbardensis MN12-7 TaxID=1150600 RepID=R9GT07_9SPHI|nr:exonuclease domain-containing protein [Arcticibacter svalbardensis]EOR94823.1 DNA polymerase III epsilon subunit [Arcticibacter svalbardensis MN12-7]